jgi:hypothetical protein
VRDLDRQVTLLENDEWSLREQACTHLGAQVNLRLASTFTMRR